MKNISHNASNRLVCLNPKQSSEKETVSVRYLDRTLKEAYRCFKGNKSICFSTFCKYIEKRYKKPHHLTDICRYCEYGMKLKKEIIKRSKEVNYSQNVYNEKDDSKFNVNTSDLLMFFKSINEKDVLSKINDLVAIKFHRKISQIQRESYNRMRKTKICSKTLY